MRHIRVQHLFSSTHGAPDQIRRSLDVVIACALLAITAPLMLLVALAGQGKKPGAGFGKADVHRARRPPVSDAEIPDSDARPGPHIADLG